MSLHDKPDVPITTVGTRVHRREDRRLLTGQGRFVDKVSLTGAAHAVIIRSRIAHGVVTAVDFEAARAATGVLDVIGPSDAEGAELPCVSTVPEQPRSYPVLDEVVRYVGQPVAVLIAETYEAALDAVALVEVHLTPLAEVAGVEAALANDAPVLHDGSKSNLIADFPIGDPAAAVAEAPHVIEMTFRLGRVTPRPIEPRGIAAVYDGDVLTVWNATQAPHHARDHLAQALNLPQANVRVVAGDVGGSFGAKEHIYPDEVVVCLAAMRLRRPVRWSETPGDQLTATVAARDAIHVGRLAFEADGRFVALHCDILGNLGAHPSNVGFGPLALSAIMLAGPYRFDSCGARVRGVVTNTTPTGSYRGFGQPEITWTRERLIDEAARSLHLDPVELRLRNMFGPDDFVLKDGTWHPYDSGDFPLALRTLRELVREVPADDNRKRGIGFSCHVESTGMGPSMAMKGAGVAAGGFETIVLRMEPDASVTVCSGLVGIGQGIETAFAQLAADGLRVPLDRVKVVMGDTETSPYSSIGAVASRSTALGGGALVRAAESLRARLLALAAHRLEVSADDLEYADGCVRVVTDPANSLALADLAAFAWRGWDLPKGVGPGLEERTSYDPTSYVHAFGAHAAAVAFDPETGAVEVEKYWVVNDSGVLVNPTIVEGQIVGGVAQGIGMALTEEITYSDNAQPSANYPLMTAPDIPRIEVVMLETASPVTPGGMKGAGEAGIISSPAAIGNAVAAAMPTIADQIVATPLTAHALWQALIRAAT
ncbi:xanthine dehydrogenase family protein molybdopterin-binding subunit [Actinokineospora sp. HUAS TT18]|uniref:xanthine dehydrogenase family protein molybdopterin-binding subunit n=1 Tax=Actinokineospora sp. HUAS TT18 TaxID=3447451 RepID=UPI003F521BE6